MNVPCYIVLILERYKWFTLLKTKSDFEKQFLKFKTNETVYQVYQVGGITTPKKITTSDFRTVFDYISQVAHSVRTKESHRKLKYSVI